MSTTQQESVVKAAFEFYVQTRPDWSQAQWGGFFKDEGVSRTTKLREREAGSVLLSLVQPGDVILVSNFDRIFANVLDVCEMFEIMEQQQFRVLILDMDIPISTDLGKCVFKIMAIIKEMEVQEIRRRTREAMAHLRASGRPLAGKHSAVPIGWRLVAVREHNKHKPQWYYLPDHDARRAAKALRQQRNTHGWGFRKLASWACENIPHPQGRVWNIYSVKDWLAAEANGFLLPNGTHNAAPIPPDADPWYDDAPTIPHPDVTNPKPIPRPPPEPALITPQPEKSSSVLDIFKTGITS